VQQAATQPLLSLRTAIVMLAALGIGMVVGCLTVRTGASVEASVLAGLTSAGASAPLLSSLIG
jgi:predicted branched-subunit amino acid permease